MQGICYLFNLGLAAPGSPYHWLPFLSALFYNKHWSKDLELVTSEALPACLSSFCLIVSFFRLSSLFRFVPCLLVCPSSAIAKSFLEYPVGVSCPGLPASQGTCCPGTAVCAHAAAGHHGDFSSVTYLIWWTDWMNCSG